MKKLTLFLIALAVISISSCKKEEVAKPQFNNDANKVAGKTLSSYD